MSDYEGMTNQDVDPIDVFAEMRDDEFRMDAEREARELEGERDQLAAYGTLPDDLDDEEDELEEED